MSNPIDEFELGVFERTADIELATKVGDAARWALTSTVEALSAALGVAVPPESVADFMFPVQ